MLKPGLKIFLIILLSITVLLSSCYIQSHNLKSPADFDKEVKISRLSLFGTLKYDLNSPKVKNKFLLLFKNNTPQYIFAGKKLKKHSSVYKVLFLSDTLNILSSEFYGEYYATDTLFFFNDECFWKQVYYNDPPYGMSKIASPAVADFHYYRFSTTECLISEKRYHYTYPTIISGTVSLSDYCNKIRSGIPTDSLIDKSYVFQKYPDKEQALLNFVQGYLH